MRRHACPVAHDFDPFDAALTADPYPAWARLRAAGPVHYSPLLDHYIVTGYADIARIFADQASFSARNASAPITPLAPEAQAVLDTGYKRQPTLNNADPPRHTAMRAAVSACMGPPRWRKLFPLLRPYAAELVEALVAKEQADLVADLCFPLPGLAAFRLLGFPPEDTALLKSWCGDRLELTYGRLPPARQVELAKILLQFWNYAVEHVALRQRVPADDMTSDLLDYARAHPDALQVSDIHSIVYSISLAGHETTANGMANALLSLLENPVHWQRLAQNPMLLANAIEELLRFNSPLVGHRRVALVDYPIGDTVIPAGARILLMIAAAHRDAAQFPEADRLDLQRENAREHLAFGGPIHYCLGAPLARFEMRTAIELLARAAPDMRLLPGQEFSYLPNIAFRGPAAILVNPNTAH